MIRFILENDIDNLTLSALPPENSKYTVNNIQKLNRGSVFRSTDELINGTAEPYSTSTYLYDLEATFLTDLDPNNIYYVTNTFENKTAKILSIVDDNTIITEDNIVTSWGSDTYTINLGLPKIQEIYGTSTDTKRASSLVLGRHNFSRYITYQLILYLNDDWTTEVYNSGTLHVDNEEIASDFVEWGEFYWGIRPWDINKKGYENIQFRNIVHWFTPIDYKSFKIVLSFDLTALETLYFNNNNVYFNNTNIYFNNSQDPIEGQKIPYYEIGRVFLGEYIEPTYNISAGHDISWQENTKQYRASSGTLRSDIATKNKNFSFSLNTITESDRTNIQKKLMKLGMNKDFYISIFSDAETISKSTDYSEIVKLTKIPKYTHIICDYYKANYEVEEV